MGKKGRRKKRNAYSWLRKGAASLKALTRKKGRGGRGGLTLL